MEHGHQGLQPKPVHRRCCPVQEAGSDLCSQLFEACRGKLGRSDLFTLLCVCVCGSEQSATIRYGLCAPKGTHLGYHEHMARAS